jgi:SAM-dependent methyltransferase
MSTVPGKKYRQSDWDEVYRLGTPPWDTGRPSPELVRLVEQGLVGPRPTLEIGCGTGANAVYLSRKRFDITAIDSSALAVERARLRCEQAGGLVRFVLADIFDFAKKAGRFEFVFDVGFYHFIRQTDLERFLDTLWWVTQPGSHYLTIAGAPGETAEGGPPQVTEEEIRAELGRLFEIIDLRPCRLESSQRQEGYPGWACLMRRPMMGK